MGQFLAEREKDLDDSGGEEGWVGEKRQRGLRQWKTIELEQPRPESGADVAAVPSCDAIRVYSIRCTMARIWVVVSVVPVACPPEGYSPNSASPASLQNRCDIRRTGPPSLTYSSTGHPLLSFAFSAFLPPRLVLHLPTPVGLGTATV